MAFDENLASALAAVGLEADEKQTARFQTYRDLLLEWNEKMNLTAITDEAGILQKHFADSLSPLQFKAFSPGLRLLDVGTGAGFPGVPLKIMCEDLEVTLLDSLNKRVGFLNELIVRLNLEGIRALHGRAEDYARNPAYRESFDIVVSRAVARLAVLAEYCLPYLKTGGFFVAFKGAESAGELEEAKKAIALFGCRVDSVQTFDFMEGTFSRSLLFIYKERHTPPKYPRKAGLINKSPII